MLYHGVDLVEVARIGQTVTRWGDRFLRRVFTSIELADADSRTASLAARFAAKEATAKALGVGLRGFGANAVVGNRAVAWREIEVVRDEQGKPKVRLSGGAAARAAQLGWQQIELSLTHTADLALASVVALSPSS